VEIQAPGIAGETRKITTRNIMIIPYSYYGAKGNMVDNILPLLPACDHFVETHAGSALITLNRKPSPIETVNDINGDITHFFRMLRSRKNQLIERLILTPYSREEFAEAWIPSEDPVERAARFFIRMNMDVAKAGKLCDMSWYSNVKFCPDGHSYAPFKFMKKVKGLYQIATRLKGIQLENRDACMVIKKYDGTNTLFYLDPPYLPSTRTSSNNYLFDMTLEQHEQLAAAANKATGMVALSGYDHPVMNDLYPAGGISSKWKKVAFNKKQLPMSRGKKRFRQECLWMNYDINLINGQLNLFE
jgi:DNA adenine methylase